MKRLILFAAVMLFSAAGLFAQNENSDYIEVVGKAEKEIVPDEIYMSININEKDYKNKTLSQIEKSMFKSLSAIGINTKDQLSVTDLASDFKKYLILKNDVKLAKNYQLLVHDAKTAGKVIIELQKIGISDVSITRIDNSKLEQYRNEIRIDAIKNAKEKANTLVEAIGQTIGKAIYIREQEGYYPRSYAVNDAKVMYSMAEGADEAFVPDVEFETIKIESSVVVRFRLP